MTRTELSESMNRDLRAVAQGYSRGESATTCEALCRRGLLRGDWITGYYVTKAGEIALADYLDYPASAFDGISI